MINIYNIETSMGKITPWGDQLTMLTFDEIQEFNHIGYTGKNLAGKKISFECYLNSLNKGEFKVDKTKFDDGSFGESYTIVHVTK